MTNEPMMPIAEVTAKLQSAGLGFDRVELLHGSTFTDTSTVILIPTRGMVSHRVVTSIMGLISPMNTRGRAILFVTGDEVGHAYNRMIEQVIAHPVFSTWKYILTLEDDNIQPADAHIRLLESITLDGGFDAVSGLYFTKGDYGMPMAYGDPEHYRRTGQLTFEPRDTLQAINKGQVMEVNGIAMGCALWRMDLFKNSKGPWFVTVNDVIPEKGPMLMTQDLYFCRRARESGKRFAVDCRVKVGHLDINTGIVY